MTDAIDESRYALMVETKWPREIAALEDFPVSCRFMATPDSYYSPPDSQLGIRVSHMNGHEITKDSDSDSFGIASGRMNPKRHGRSTSQFIGPQFRFTAPCQGQTFKLEVFIMAWPAGCSTNTKKLARSYSPEIKVKAPVSNYSREWYENANETLSAQIESLRAENQSFKSSWDEAERLLEMERAENSSLKNMLDQADAVHSVLSDCEAAPRHPFSQDSPNAMSDDVVLSPAGTGCDTPRMNNYRLDSVCSSTGHTTPYLSPRSESTPSESVISESDTSIEWEDVPVNSLTIEYP